MFSPIECRLRPSRLAQVVIWLPAPLVALIALAADRPLWLTVLAAAVLQWVLWQTRPANPPAQQLRWQGADLVLFDAERNAERWLWTGQGRRSASYLRLLLIDETTAMKRSLMLWRDSLDDPSWRALNAYFRIHSAQIQAER